ncbi:hypothetical protein IW140_002213 [Coemansia sp. RSA 1813]|nr:hypothetical protein EV178_001721 [Coemansia sp. RSA 1646]KAJ1770543.1 hypothetical protein LPJ74_003070 [Coemansia sp. RSA 1843]KAJ2216285.1 hypothetical protein EV179_001524 [Coemansia sp. RSA 487]KAJ2570542.1 hypothetical protein IW140_002213 [Coemansia sp. RSA 1813]
MFGFKKSKAKRNIRKRDDSATESGMENDDAPTDVVKRNSKSTPRQESRTLGASSGTVPSFGGNEEDVPLKNTKKNRTNLQIKEFVGDNVTGDENAVRTYSYEELYALKRGSVRPDDMAPMDVDLGEQPNINQEESVYPFASEGIPNAQDIYMAKKLRRQRQAEQRMVGDDAENNEDMADIRESDDFIALNDDMANSRIRSTTNQELLDDGTVEGEDEMDTVIVDKNDRAEFNRNLRMAKEESIEHAQDEDEPSDWENEQLRNAGVASIAHGSGSKHAHAVSLPKDTGNYKHDGSHLTFLLEQEKDQLALEEDHLKAAKERCEQSSNALEDLTKQLSEAQVQWDHFSSLVRSL